MMSLSIALILITFSLAFSEGTKCRFAKDNPSNAGQSITVSSTAVTVIPTDERFCSGYIYNLTGQGEIRCRPIAEGDPTTTVGVRIEAGKSISLNNSARQGWKCIRTGGTDGIVDVAIERE